MRAKHPYLKCYVGDWPVKEYLKRQFSNQRNYKNRREREAQATFVRDKAVYDTWERRLDFGTTDGEDGDGDGDA
jgi:hypothetical protein